MQRSVLMSPVFQKHRMQQHMSVLRDRFPIIPQNIISATITAYPITPDQIACDIGMDSARIPPSIRLGTQIMIPAWIMATSAQLFLSSIGTCSSVTDSTFPAFFSCSTLIPLYSFFISSMDSIRTAREIIS